MNNTIEAFLALIRGGLWEQEVELQQYGEIDFSELMNLAEEQAVVGLVTAGLEHVVDVKVPQEWTLQFIGATLQIEQRNRAMNSFITNLIAKMKENDISTLLIKGQGIAQCYERPLWRSCGDVDFLLNEENYEKSKLFLKTLASSIDSENSMEKHLAMEIDSWVVEIHGTMRSLFLKQMDKGIDEIQEDIFVKGNVRSWRSDNTQISLPGINSDVPLVFSHIIKHFFKGGIGLRQICDLYRLLFVFKDDINTNTIESHLKRMGMISEWKVFSCFAVQYLGVPMSIIPLSSNSFIRRTQARMVLSYVIKTGNFGHNLDRSYFSTKPYIVRKAISFWRHTAEYWHHFLFFPADSLRVWMRMLYFGLKAVFS